MTEKNRIDALLNGEQSPEEEAIAQLTSLADVYCAESRAADIVADKVLRGHFRYNPGLGWMEWDGRRWDRDPVAEPRIIETVRQYADTAERNYRAIAANDAPARQAIVERVVARCTPEQRTTNRGRVRGDRELFNLYATEADKEEMTNLAAAGEQAEMWLNLLSAGKVNAVIKLCRGMDGIITRVAEFDAHDDLANCANGILDLRTGEVTPHDPEMLFTHTAGGDYSPGAQAEPWTQALEAIPDEIREWYQIRMGQAFTGHTPDDDSLILEHGGGENGKTVVKMALLRALGSYARTISHRVLTATTEQHPTELMDLRGLRLAIMEETPEEGRLDPHRIKTTIGTEFITARLMRRDDVTFRTSHTLSITSNHWPMVDSTDHGTWRRLKGMEWPLTFLAPGVLPTRDAERPGDRTIKHRIRTDPDVPAAVLAWIVEGAKKWYALGQVMPEDPPFVKETTEVWRKSCDVCYQFAIDYLIEDSNAYITADVMARELNDFLVSQEKKKWSHQLINSRMASSLLAVGIRIEGTPRSPLKVRAGDTESKPGGGEEPVVGWRHQPGKVLRMWRGVRFKTTAEQSGGHLSAVRTG
jgi:P4 family phage/plasmid primase-like protien